MNETEKLQHLIKMLRWYIRYHEDKDYQEEANELYGKAVLDDQLVTVNFMKSWLRNIGEKV